MQAWAENALRQANCLAPEARCQFREASGCADHASCGAGSWCDDAHDCQLCAHWDPADLSSSVTATAPASCARPGWKADPCWVLRVRGCPCSHHGCFCAADCRASPLCERRAHSHSTRAPPLDRGRKVAAAHAHAHAGPSSAAIVTALCHASTRGCHRRAQCRDEYTRSAALLLRLLRSLAHVKTTLPIYTTVCGRRENDTEARLESLGTRVLAAAHDVAPPSWAAPHHRGTFAKLAVLGLGMFRKIVFLDNDCEVLRNVDHLARLPTPSMAFHAPDGGPNSGVMVLAPEQGLDREALRLVGRPSPPAALAAAYGRAHLTRRRGAGDQEVWVALFNRLRQPIYELPSGYNFRWGFEMSHRERCSVHIVHSASHARRAPSAAKLRALSCHFALRASNATQTIQRAERGR